MGEGIGDEVQRIGILDGRHGDVWRRVVESNVEKK